MNKITALKPLIELVIGLFLVLVLHFYIFNYFFSINNQSSHFVFSLSKIYTFFAINSFAIILILILIKKKSIDYVGYVFMLLTCIKMGITFYFAQPILALKESNNSIEYKNFLILFLIFLAVETTISIRILNKKQCIK